MISGERKRFIERSQSEWILKDWKKWRNNPIYSGPEFQSNGHLKEVETSFKYNRWIATIMIDDDIGRGDRPTQFGSKCPGSINFTLPTQKSKFEFPAIQIRTSNFLPFEFELRISNFPPWIFPRAGVTPAWDGHLQRRATWDAVPFYEEIRISRLDYWNLKA